MQSVSDDGQKSGVGVRATTEPVAVESGRDPAVLRAALDELRASGRPPRQRDAADQLGVSEAELVACQIGAGANALAPRWPEIFSALEGLGGVMALTRNEHAVIENHGVYRGFEGFGPVAQVVADTIDLRLFFSQWASGFGLVEKGRRGAKRSLQFFDRSGAAVHKIFLREHSDVAAYEQLVARLAADEQRPGIDVVPIVAEPEDPDEGIDVAALRGGWLAMRDTHEFHGLLRRLGVGRLQALRLAGPELARQIGPESFARALDRAAAAGLSIMIFVGNRGCIQIHSGVVSPVVHAHDWLNLLEPGFNLHVREAGVASVWVVRKPADHGLVTSLEVYDDQGNNVALVFANRKEGQPTVEAWAEILARIPEVSR